MSRMLTLAAVALLVLTLAACSSDAPVEETGDAAPAPAPDVAVTVVEGDWELNEEVPGTVLTDNQRALFEKAAKRLKGVELEPVAVIGEQIVAGTNSAYLCHMSGEQTGGQTVWGVAVVYKNLEGEAMVSAVREVDLADLRLTEPTDAAILGGWKAPETTAADTLPQKAQTAFDVATENRSERLIPVALLGTRELEDTDYCILCVGDAASINDAAFAVTISQDAQNVVRVSATEPLDMPYYTTGPAPATK